MKMETKKKKIIKSKIGESQKLSIKTLLRIPLKVNKKRKNKTKLKNKGPKRTDCLKQLQISPKI